MSWEQQHKEHLVWEVADQVESKLRAAYGENELDPQDLDVDRLGALVKYVASFKEQPHVTINTEQLDQAESQLKQIVADLPNMDAVQRQRTVNGKATRPVAQLMTLVRSWPSPSHQRLDHLGHRTKAIGVELDELRDSVGRARTELEEALDLEKQSIGEKVEGRASELTERLDSINTTTREVTSQIDRLRDQTGREEQRLTSAIDSADKKFNEFGQEAEKQWEAQFSTYTARSNEILDRIKETKAQAEKVLQGLGAAATATHYGKYAEDEKKSADRYRLIAGGLIIAAAFWLSLVAFNAWGLGTGDNVWVWLFQRVGVPTALVTVGTLAMRESSGHRRQERAARQNQLVLTTVDPFVATLPDDARNDIRAEAAKALFVLRDQAVGTKKSPVRGRRRR